MSRFGYVMVTYFATMLFIALFVAVAWISPHPRLLWNASASAPIGLYRVRPIEHPAAGDLVAIVPPPVVGRFMAERNYLPSGLPLIKHVAAVPGQMVCRVGTTVTIDGHRATRALPRDRRGRDLPQWQGCHRVAAQTLFLLNPAADSFDSRYVGALPAAGLLGRAIPLLTRDAPGAPLVWRGLAAPASVSPKFQDTPHANRQLHENL